jgi:hypothetical protein
METAGPIIALDLVRVLKKCTAPNEKRIADMKNLVKSKA